jgi:hypothetical protein
MRGQKWLLFSLNESPELQDLLSLCTVITKMPAQIHVSGEISRVKKLLEE